jgi:hypothetical protein
MKTSMFFDLPPIILSFDIHFLTDYDGMLWVEFDVSGLHFRISAAHGSFRSRTGFILPVDLFIFVAV